MKKQFWFAISIMTFISVGFNSANAQQGVSFGCGVAVAGELMPCCAGPNGSPQYWIGTPLYSTSCGFSSNGGYGPTCYSWYAEPDSCCGMTYTVYYEDGACLETDNYMPAPSIRSLDQLAFFAIPNLSKRLSW